MSLRPEAAPAAPARPPVPYPTQAPAPCWTGASAGGEARLASVLAAGGAHLRARGLGAVTGAKPSAPPPDYTAKDGGKYYADKAKLDADMTANVRAWEEKRREFEVVMKAEGKLAQTAVNEYKKAVDAQLENMRKKMEDLHKLLDASQQGADKNDTLVKEKNGRIASLLAENKALEEGKKAEIEAAVAKANVEADQAREKLAQQITELRRKVAEAEKKDVDDQKALAELTKSKLAADEDKARLERKIKEFEDMVAQIKGLVGCVWGAKKLDTDPKAKK